MLLATKNYRPWSRTLDSRYFRSAIVIIFLFFFERIGSALQGYSTGPRLCPIYILTGFPCPTCGTTRSMYWILQGNPLLAFKFNPLGFLVLGLLIFWMIDGNSRIKRLLDLANRRITFDSKSQPKLLTFFLIVLGLNYVRFVSGYFPG